MPIQYGNGIKSKIDQKLNEFAQPEALTGVELQKMTEHFGLKLTETGNALGINTSALYGKQKAPKPLQTNVSILLRLYAVFSDHIPRINPPPLKDLISLIKQADPDFKNYSIGPTLGLEITSGHRLIENGLDNAAQSTRVLAWLIYELLNQDLKNWKLIKEVILTEAAARGVPEPSGVFKRGGWGKQEPVLRHVNKAGTTGIVKKTIRRRDPSSS